jgi:ferredoxin--NADP+ reductase
MIPIEKASYLAPSVKWFRLEAPDISRKAQPGQFVIVRAEEVGERIPLTIADFDGSRFIELVVQEVGEGTRKINSLKKGDYFLNVAGPLGHPSEIDNFGTVALVGGGIGIAPIYPIARAMKQAQNKVIVIIGARTKELIFWEEKIHPVSDRVIVCTDDGSYGIKGVVTAPLKELLESGERIDRVVAIGPAIMMKFVAVTTQPYHVKTIVSLNSLMLDGTGMCGCCRVEVGGKTKFVCVDGPEFDAHQVDFELLLDRLDIYKNEEHLCQLAGKV